MRLLYLAIVLLLFALPIQGQDNFNLDSITHIDYPQSCNDIWGYVDENGDEYAILGTVTGTAILALDRGSEPEEIAFIPGLQTTWRDIKHFQDRIYVTADGVDEGLLIIDASKISEDSISYHFWQPILELNGSELGQLGRCHNLYIDDNTGICVLAGCSLNSGGAIFFDLNPNPDTPQLVSAGPSVYAHDYFYRDSLLFASEIYQGRLGIYDISDVTAPQLVGTHQTSGQFTHNAWSSNDNRWAFTTDEVRGGFVDAYDISDFGNIQRVDNWRPERANERGVIPHNTHYYNGFLVTSWYIDGLYILDASDPSNLVPVARYDSYPDDQPGFNGCWGAYPYLPSGRVLISDRESGLFVLEPNYVRAARLEGEVRDIISGDLISGAEIRIDDLQQTQTQTDGDGTYQTGTAEFGKLQVSYSANGYRDWVDTLELSEGVTLQNNVQLIPEGEVYQWDLYLIDSASQQALGDVHIQLRSEEDASFLYQTNQEGLLVQPYVYADTYQAFFGKWGWKELYIAEFLLDTQRTDTIALTDGYKDHFNLDQGWTRSATSSSGEWTRGQPNGTTFNGSMANPGFSSLASIGNYAYVTGNQGGDATNDHVSQGEVQLQSPVMDLQYLTDVRLEFFYWFFNAGNDPHGSLEIQIASPDTTVTVSSIEQSESFWRYFSFPLDSVWKGPKDSLKINFIAMNPSNDAGTVLEAAIDAFEVVGNPLPPSVTADAKERQFSIYPNPTSNRLRLFWPGPDSKNFRIYDQSGRKVYEIRNLHSNNPIELGHLPSGMYYIRAEKGKAEQLIITR